MSERRRPASNDTPRLSPVAGFFGGSKKTRPGRPRRRAERPMIESLEARLVLSTLYVDKDWNPTGPGPYYPDGAAGPAGKFNDTAFNTIQAALSKAAALGGSNTIDIVSNTGGQPANPSATSNYAENPLITSSVSLVAVDRTPSGTTFSYASGGTVTTTSFALTNGATLAAAPSGVSAATVSVDRTGSTPGGGTRIGDAVALVSPGGTVEVYGPYSASTGQYTNEAGGALTIAKSLTLTGNPDSGNLSPTTPQIHLTNGAQLLAGSGGITASTVDVDRAGSPAGAGGTRVADAILVAATGGTVNVSGTFTEDVTIDHGLLLQSLGSAGAGSIVGPASGGDAVTVAAGVGNVTIGGAGSGLNITGAGAAALNLSGNNAGVSITGDVLTAGPGGSGLVAGGGQSGLSIAGNTFAASNATPSQSLVQVSGTPNGAAASTGVSLASNAFSGSVSGSLVELGSSGTATGNTFSGTAGGAALLLDASGNTVTGNSFTGGIGAARASLETSATGNSISGNTFTADLAGSRAYFSGPAGSTYVPAILGANTFLRSVTVEQTPGASGTDLPTVWANIQAGIDAASAGNTVHVGAGTYNESPDVTKSVILSGAGSASTAIDLISADTPGANYTASLHIAGQDVTVSGFTIVGRDAVGGGLANSDIYLEPGLDQVSITGNKIEVGQIGAGSTGDDGIGIVTAYTTNPGQFVGTLTVSGNQFVPTGTSANRAFYINTGVTQFNFTGNSITGEFDGRSITEASNGLVQGNTVVGTGAAGSRSAGLGAYGDTDPTKYGHTTFTGNVFSNLSKGVSILSADGATVSNNTFTSDDTGVLLDDSYGPASDPTTDTIHDNSFDTSNTTGVRNNTATAVDATQNWWGSFRGPTSAANPGGDGDPVAGPVTFSPWLSNGTDTQPGTTGFQPSASQSLYAVPTRLVYTVAPPGTTTPGATFSVTVTAEDDAGNLGVNLDSTLFANELVTLTLGTNVGDGSLHGPTAAAPVNGVATFYGLSIDQPGEYFLSASTSGSYPAYFSTGSGLIDIAFPSPTIASLSPFEIAAGYPNSFTLTIDGTGFYGNATKVNFGSHTGLVPDSITPDGQGGMYLTVTIPASYVATAATIPVTVVSPSPGGGTSSAVNFTVASPSAVFVDNTWASLAPGTAVTASYDGQTHYIGYDAFATIQAGVNAVAVHGAVDIDNSTSPYVESNIVVAKAGVTIQGQSVVGVTLHPAGTDSHADSTFGGTAEQGFIVAASGVTIAGLTIDGGASQGYRDAIVTNSLNDGVTYNDLTVSGVTIENIFRKGIALYNNGSAISTGDTIVGNTLSGVGSLINDGGAAYEGTAAIAAFGSDATIDHNTISGSAGGIESNSGSLLAVTNNAITAPRTALAQGALGLDLADLADGSTVIGNTVDMSGDATDGVGIVVSFALGSVTVRGNTVTGSAGDDGIVLYQDTLAGTPVLLQGNTVTGAAATGTGILLTDVSADTSRFGDAPGAVYATLQGNSVSGFATGVSLAAGPDAVAATIDGSTSYGPNAITGAGAGTGILVSGTHASATISGNTGSIAGWAAGIDVNGGSATISGDHIDGNSAGILVENGGRASLSGDDFSGTRNTVDLSIAPTAGTVTIGDGNTFDATANDIVNQSSQTIDLSGTTGNTFDGVALDGAGLSALYQIEDSIVDAIDVPGYGLIRLVAGNVYVTPNSYYAPTTAAADVQRGINAATAGDTVHVEAGTYASNLTINKRLTLLGANAGLAGAAAGRGAETDLVAAGNQYAVITVTASGVTISGLTIDGNAPGVTGGTLASGVDSNTLYGITNLVNGTPTAITGLTIEDDVVQNVYVGFRGDGTSSGDLITDDKFDSIGNFDFGYAVSLRTNFYADVTDNVMTRVWTGVHTNNFHGAGPATWTMSGNQISSYAAGLWYNLQYGGATGLTVDNNQFSAESGAVANNFGVLIVSIQDAVAPTFTNNTITGTDYGFGLFNVPTTSTITLGASNSVSGTKLAGVLLTDNLNFNPVGTTNFLAGGPGFASTVNIGAMPITVASGVGIKVDASGGTATGVAVSGATISDPAGTIGIDVEGSKGSATVSGTTIHGFTTGILDDGGTLTIGAGDAITGIASGATGLVISGATSALTGDTIHDLSFSGDAGDAYIALTDGALAGQTIDATAASFDGFVAGAAALPAGLASDYAVEDRVTDRLDGGAVGFVRLKAGDVFLAHSSEDSAAGSAQRAIDVASAGDTVYVQAGTYVADSAGNPGGLYVDKSLTLLGAQAGVDARGRTAGETTILPGASDPNPNDTTAVVVVYVAASDVTIDGLTIDGHNGALADSGNTFNGANAAEGIASYDGVGGITVRNNIIKDTSYTGVDFYNYANPTATAGNLITQNQIEDLGGGGYGYGIGVLLYNNFYADVTANTIQDVRVGIQTGNFSAADPSDPATTAVLSGNTISASRRGIFYNLHYGSASPFTVEGNSITAVNDPTATSANWVGIEIASQQGTVGASFVDNMIDGSAATSFAHTSGYTVWSDPTTGALTISGGSVKGVEYGVWVNSYEGYSSEGDAASVAVTGLTITGATGAGVYVEDSAANANHPAVTASLTNVAITGSATGILVTGANASVGVGSGDTITGGTTGLMIDGATAGLVGDTLNDIAFSGQSGDYIALADGALAGHTIDATAASFDGFVAGAGPLPASLASDYAVEDRVTDRLDGGAVGFVRLKAGDVFVTQKSETAAADAIQRGIDAATSGDTVYVQAGSFVGNLSIAKTIHLLGANAGIDPNTGTRGAETTLSPAANDASLDSNYDPVAPIIHVSGAGNGVVIDGLTLDGRGQSSAGIYFDQVSGVTVQNDVIENLVDFAVIGDNQSLAAASTGNLIRSNRFANIPGQSGLGFGEGVDAEDNFYASIQDNVMTGVRRGMQITNDYLANTGAPVVISGNTIDAGQIGIWINDNWGSAGSVSITGNTLSSSFVSEVVSPGTADANRAGIFFSSLFDGIGAVTASGNTVNAGFDYGILAWNNSQPVTVVGTNAAPSTVTGSIAGVELEASNPYYGEATLSGTLTLDGVVVQAAQGGIGVALVGDATNTNVISVALTDGVQVEGGATGLSLDGQYVGVAGNSLADTSFTGQSGDYITLASGALAGQVLDATAASFAGHVAGSDTTADLYAVEDKITDNLDDPTLGYVTLQAGNVYVTPHSEATNAGAIQRAIGDASAGDTLHIAGGSYTGSVDTGTKGLTIDLGDPVQVTIVGDLTLHAGDTLDFDIEGSATPGTTYDQLVVQGQVGLGGATLSLGGGISGVGYGTLFDLIDGNMPIQGTFAGIPQGSYVVFNGETYQAFYDGGSDGDDFVLINVNGAGAIPPAPSDVYVDQAWATLHDGDAVTVGRGQGASTHYIGVDAFAAIQPGVDVAASGGTVHVLDQDLADDGGTVAYTYAENVTIDKALTLVGPYDGASGAGRSASDEATIAPSGGDAITVTAGSGTVTISGFTITSADGDAVLNTGSASLVVGDDILTGGGSAAVDASGAASATVSDDQITGYDFGIKAYNLGGGFTAQGDMIGVTDADEYTPVGIDAENLATGVVVITGDTITGGVNDILLKNLGTGGATVSGNTLSGAVYGALTAYYLGGALTVQGNTITSNTGVGVGIAIAYADSAAVQIGGLAAGQGNTISDSNIGIEMTMDTGGSDTIQGNTLTGITRGGIVYFGDPNGGNSTLTIQGNSITIATDGYGPGGFSGPGGILVSDPNTGVLIGGPDAADANTITAADATGIEFSTVGNPTAPGVIQGNTITAATGVLLDGGPSIAQVTGNTIDDTAVGIDVVGEVATISGNTIHDTSRLANVGVEVSGAYGSATLSGNTIYGQTTGVEALSGGSLSIDTTTFYAPGESTNGTDLLIAADAGTVTIGSNNAFHASGYYIDDRSTQSYDLTSDGTTFYDQSGNVQTDNFRIEDGIYHAVDQEGLGLVTWVADHVFVTTPGSANPGTTDTDSTIQRGIDAVPAGQSGWTVEVEAGTYTEQLDIAKPITLVGAGQGQTVIQSPGTLTSKFSTGSSTTNDPIVFVHGLAAGQTATIQGLTVDGNGQGNGNYRFFGVVFYDASGTVDHVTVTGVSDSPLSGNQDGVGVEALDDNGSSQAFTLSNSTVEGYQKNGVVVAGAGLNGTVTGNVVTGSGATPTIAQNGIEIYGAVATVSGNTVSGNRYTGTQNASSTGILLYEAGAGTSVSGNTLDGNDVGLYGYESAFTAIGNTLGGTAANGTGIVGDIGSASLIANQITGGQFGIALYGLTGTTDISGGSITGAAVGILVDNFDGATNASISGVTVSGATTAGVLVDDEGTGQNASAAISGSSISGTAGAGVDVEGADASATVATTTVDGFTTGILDSGGALTVGSGDSIVGGTTGLVISGTSATLAGNTLGDLAFTGQSGNYITLAAGALGGATPTEIDATHVSFDGSVGSSLDPSNAADLATFFGIEDKVTDYIDDATLGFVRLKAGNVFVTPGSETPHVGAIQRGINAATAGDTVHTEAGTYNESGIVANKAVTVLGQGSGTSGTVVASSGGATGITIAASGVTLQGLRFTGQGRAGYGIEIDSAVGNDALNDVVSTGFNSGLEIHNSAVVTGLSLTGVGLTGDSVGLRVATTGSLNGLTVTGSHFDGDDYGLYTAANGASSTNQNGFTNINIGTSSFDNDQFKGIYAEKLDHATLDHVESIGSGYGASSPDGINLNLKYGNFTAIAITNSTLTNDGTGSTTGAALAIDGRNDGSYASHPASITGVTLTNDLIGGTSPIDLGLYDNVSGVTMSGVRLDGGGLGLSYSSDASGLNLGDTAFAGSLAGYIIDGSTFGIDATQGATFDGFATGSSDVPSNLPTFFGIDDKIVDGRDVAGLGLVRLHAGDVFITPTSKSVPTLGTLRDAIQRGINVAAAGDTAYIEAGTYAEDNVNVNKSLTLIGQLDGQGNPITTLTPATSTGGDSLTVSADNVTVANLALPNAHQRGLVAAGVSNLTLDHVSVTAAALDGIALTNVTTAGLTDVVADGNDTAISPSGNGLTVTDGSGLTVTGGDFSSNNNDGITLTRVAGATLSGVTANSNLGDGLTATGSGLDVDLGTFSNNASSGIFAIYETGVTLTGVTAGGNGLSPLNLSGVEVDNSTDVTIDGGTFDNNGGTDGGASGSGIYLSGDGGAITIRGAIDASSNALDGIQIEGGSPTKVSIGQAAGSAITLTGNGAAGLSLIGLGNPAQGIAVDAAFTRDGVAGAVGLLVAGTGSSGAASPVGVTLAGSSFSGYDAADKAITLSSDVPQVAGSEIGTADVNAEGVSFDGTAITEANFATLDPALVNAISAEIYDKIADPALGRVFLLADTLIATPNTKLQPVLNAATDNERVLIYATPNGYNYGETNYFGGKGLELVGIDGPTTSSIELQSGAAVLPGTTGFLVPTVYVDSGASINDGITLVTPGGTVDVAAGTFHGTVGVAKSLTLRGTTGTTIAATAGSDGIDVTGAGTTAYLDGLTVVGATAPGASGISLAAGTKAKLTNDVVSNNTIGVTVNGASAFLQGDTLGGDTSVGLLVEGGALVDAGQKVANAADFTGFGISSGGNVFHGYGNGSYAIENSNTGTINGVNYNIAGSNDAPPALLPTPHYDTMAQGNDFGTTLDSAIESIVLHDIDDPTRGFVRFDVSKPDITAPTSTVATLALNQTTSTTFNVTINAVDPTSAQGDPDEVVSGVGSYNLYYQSSTDGGSTWTAWTLYNGTPQASSTFAFTGSENTLYRFYGQAIDRSGNVQPYAPTAEATTYIQDLTPPSTQVNSVTQVIDSASGQGTTNYTVSFGGADNAGGTGLARIDLYVVQDNGSPVLLTSVSPNTTGSSPSPTYTYTFVAPRDGVSHTFRFYTVGTDERQVYNGTGFTPSGTPNVEAAPAAPNDVTITTDFAVPTITGVVVNGGTTINGKSFAGNSERSYVDSLVVTLNDPSLVALLIAHPSWINVEQFGLDGTTVKRANIANMTASAVAGQPNQILLNFGAGGIGGPGTQDSNSGDGIYQVNFNYDGSGLYTNSGTDYNPTPQTVRFFRLLGDVDGNGVVNSADYNAETNAQGLAYNPKFDTDGDGNVSTRDRNNVQSARLRNQGVTGTYTY